MASKKVAAGTAAKTHSQICYEQRRDARGNAAAISVIDELTTMGPPGDEPADWDDENAMEAWMTAVGRHGTIAQTRRAAKLLERHLAALEREIRKLRAEEVSEKSLRKLSAGMQARFLPA